MDIVPIFVRLNPQHCHLWSAVYDGFVDEKGRPINAFRKLINDWNDTEHLLTFFKEHEADLRTGYHGMSIDQAIDKVFDEVNDFEAELKEAERNGQGFNDIFEMFHKDEYLLRKRGNEQMRKARPYADRAMLRLYAVALENDCYVISGGAIKLRDKMDNEYLDNERKRLERLREYLENEGIISVLGLV